VRHLRSAGILVPFHATLDGAQIHWFLDDLGIIVQLQTAPIDGLAKRRQFLLGEKAVDDFGDAAERLVAAARRGEFALRHVCFGERCCLLFSDRSEHWLQQSVAPTSDMRLQWSLLYQPLTTQSSSQGATNGPLSFWLGLVVLLAPLQDLIKARFVREERRSKKISRIGIGFGKLLCFARSHQNPQRRTNSPASRFSTQYASSTSQIALNEPTEYKDGRLVCFVNDSLKVLERVAGSMVQHPPKVLHGVTSLTSGTKQGLFVVDPEDGLGERGVIEVTRGHVRSFLRKLQTSERPTDSVKNLC